MSESPDTPSPGHIVEAVTAGAESLLPEFDSRLPRLAAGRTQRLNGAIRVLPRPSAAIDAREFGMQTHRRRQ